MRVSAAGLASRRSSWANASITSAASNARLRRPSVICLRIPASTSRVIAPLVAGSDRPIRRAAPPTVSTGAPGMASTSS